MIERESAQNLILKLNALMKLSDDSINAILEITELVKFTKGSLVQDIGKSCKNLYFIHEGSLRIFYLKDGNDITESFEFEGSFVARGESLLTMKPSSKGIEAIEDSQLMQINTPKLFALFATNLEIERAFHKMIEQAYIQQINRLESIQFHTAEQRYAQLCQENPKAIQRIPLKFIASFLGITQVSLSRIRAKKVEF